MEENIRELLLAIKSIAEMLVNRTTEDMMPKETASTIMDTGKRLL